MSAANVERRQTRQAVPWLSPISTSGAMLSAAARAIVGAEGCGKFVFDISSLRNLAKALPTCNQ
ncbi:hypothetical protein GGH14_006514, partial [Coemansia sp. RSA 370]